MSELKLLFDQMATELERGETNIDYAVAHFRVASKIAEQILDACKTRGIEPLSLVIDSRDLHVCVGRPILRARRKVAQDGDHMLHVLGCKVVPRV